MDSFLGSSLIFEITFFQDDLSMRQMNSFLQIKSWDNSAWVLLIISFNIKHIFIEKVKISLITKIFEFSIPWALG
jgi:uncharacterized membrane protein YjfL (UPF0719 family)